MLTKVLPFQETSSPIGGLEMRECCIQNSDWSPRLPGVSSSWPFMSGFERMSQVSHAKTASHSNVFDETWGACCL